MEAKAEVTGHGDLTASGADLLLSSEHLGSRPTLPLYRATPTRGDRAPIVTRRTNSPTRVLCSVTAPRIAENRQTANELRSAECVCFF